VGRHETATTSDPALAAAAYDLLSMFPVLCGIPLSLLSLVTGVVLGATSEWGILRYAWVTAKLRRDPVRDRRRRARDRPHTEQMPGSGSESLLIAASVYDVAALLLATGLSVFKPGRARDRGRIPAQAAVSR
jgi:hypothetical protein